jgi:exo-beta-1,3-glucanase (GH17 family)
MAGIRTKGGDDAIISAFNPEWKNPNLHDG